MADATQLANLAANVRSIAMAAIVEAQRQGVATVEAEHILLAIAGDRHSPAGNFLDAHGLGHAELLEALRTERERSLDAVGVRPRDPAQLAATRIQRPRWGASARTAFDRAQRHATRRHRGMHRMTAVDLLHGVLCLELGTVPRMLAYAGIDRTALLAEVTDPVGLARPPGGEPASATA